MNPDVVPHAGVRNLGVTLAVVGYFGFYTQQLDLAWVYINFVPLLSAAVLFSFALSACLYVTSFRKGALLAKGGNTGNPCFLPAISYLILDACNAETLQHFAKSIRCHSSDNCTSKARA